MAKRKKVNLEEVSFLFIYFLGTPLSIFLHTLFFVGIFILLFFGFTVDQVLLILTTTVSLEAIYLSLFLQMSVNKTSENLRDVEEDIEDIQEDVEQLDDNFDEIQEDVEEISEDIEDIQEGHKEKKPHPSSNVQHITDQLTQLQHEITSLRAELRSFQKDTSKN